jgi:uncharacterized Zn finger protein (UPF0148 family)
VIDRTLDRAGTSPLRSFPHLLPEAEPGMVDLTVCKSCSSPIVPGHAFCPSCGAALQTTATASVEAEEAVEFEDPRLIALGMASSQIDPAAADREGAPVPQVDAQAPATEGLPVDAAEARRSSARDAAARAAAAAREAAAKAAAEKVAAVNAAADTDAGPEPISNPLVPEWAQAQPAPDRTETSDRILAPSATNRTLGSIGAGRPSATPAATIVPGPAQVSGAAVNVAGRADGPATAQARDRPAAPVVPLTASQQIKATLRSIAAEPKAELAATGLTALGGAFALVSFFMPWAGQNGLGVGTVGLNPGSGALDSAAGWPLFAIVVVLLAAILATDKLEELMPGLAPTIRRLTEAAIPMFLGGLLLGVGLLYQTLPWGCGGGIALLVLGAALLIAGSIVGLFFPAGQRRD